MHSRDAVPWSDWYFPHGVTSLEGSGTYGIYQAGLPEASKQKLTPVVNAGVQGEGYQGVYDGTAHSSVSLQGA